MSKIPGILSTIVIMAVTTGDAQDKTASRGDDPTAAILVANERALQNAVAKADKGTFLSLVVPDGVWTTSQGFIPMKLLVDGLDGFRLTKWDVVNPLVTRLGDDSAIV